MAVHPTRTKAGSYRIQFRGANGKVTSRTFPTVRQAEEAASLVAAKAGLDQIGAGGCGVTVREQCEKWVRLRQLKDLSRVRYEDVLERMIAPRIGDLDLAEVTRDTVDEWTVQIQGAGYKPATVLLAWTLLHSALKAAVPTLIPDDPSRGASKPKVPSIDRDVLDPAGLRAVVAAAGEPYGTMIHTLGVLGVRWSECVGLRRRDVNIRSRDPLAIEVAVRSQLHRIPGVGWRRDELKVATHKRKLTAVDAAAAPLAELVDRLEEPEALLFEGPRGGPVDATWFRTKIWQPALRRAKLPQLRLHDLRHSSAAMLVALGADVKAVQARLGHTSAKMTLDTYGHLYPSQDQAAAVAQAAALSM
jgi:integrase